MTIPSKRDLLRPGPRCPICGGIVEPHDGSRMQCSSCGQLINKGELQGVGH